MYFATSSKKVSVTRWDVWILVIESLVLISVGTAACVIVSKYGYGEEEIASKNTRLLIHNFML